MEERYELIENKSAEKRNLIWRMKSEIKIEV